MWWAHNGSDTALKEARPLFRDFKWHPDTGGRPTNWPYTKELAIEPLVSWCVIAQISGR